MLSRQYPDIDYGTAEALETAKEGGAIVTKDHLATLQRVLTEWGSGCAEGDAAAWAITEIEALKQELHQIKNDLTAARLENDRLQKHNDDLLRLSERRAYRTAEPGADLCSDPGWEYRNGKTVCKGCGKTANEVFGSPDTAVKHSEKSTALPCVWAAGCQDVPRCTEAGKCLQISRKGSAVNTESGAPGREAGDRAGPRVSRHTEKSESLQPQFTVCGTCQRKATVTSQSEVKLLGIICERTDCPGRACAENQRASIGGNANHPLETLKKRATIGSTTGAKRSATPRTHEEIKAAWAATLKHLEGGDRLAREVDAELNPGWPPDFAKPRFVVPDNQVKAFREEFGDVAEIIPLSETYLPIG